MSAAKITASARTIASGSSGWSVPSAPCVSTSIWCPISSACRFSASAAISVWAMPVGQAVTATNLMTPSSSYEDLASQPSTETARAVSSTAGPSRWGPICVIATAENAVASAAISPSSSMRRMPAIVPATIASPAPTVLATEPAVASRRPRRRPV